MADQIEKYEQVLKDAQYRKGLSIAFFNATNAAIELCKVSVCKTDEERELFVQRWRNWFLSEHTKYYAEVISDQGKENFKVSDSLKKLQKVKSLEDLQKVWQLYSEDERHNNSIIKAVKELKKKYVKTTVKVVKKKKK